MNNIAALFPVNNQTTLVILMTVLIAFVVLLTALGIVFIIALRKRRPVVKVLMAPTNNQGESGKPVEVASVSMDSEKVKKEVALTTAQTPAESTVPEKAYKEIPECIVEEYESLYFHGFTNYPYLFSGEFEILYPERTPIVKKSERPVNEGYRIGRVAKQNVSKNYSKTKEGYRIATARRKVV